MLLCDFHIHTNYSDGKLSVPEVVDFYGRLGFDCICITDHLADPRRLIGKLARLSNMTVSEDQLGRIFRSHRARTPARVAEIQDDCDDGNRVQQGRLHAKNPPRTCSASI